MMENLSLLELFKKIFRNSKYLYGLIIFIIFLSILSWIQNYYGNTIIYALTYLLYIIYILYLFVYIVSSLYNEDLLDSKDLSVIRKYFKQSIKILGLSIVYLIPTYLILFLLSLVFLKFSYIFVLLIFLLVIITFYITSPLVFLFILFLKEGKDVGINILLKSTKIAITKDYFKVFLKSILFSILVTLIFNILYVIFSVYFIYNNFILDVFLLISEIALEIISLMLTLSISFYLYYSIKNIVRTKNILQTS